MGLLRSKLKSVIASREAALQDSLAQRARKKPTPKRALKARLNQESTPPLTVHEIFRAQVRATPIAVAVGSPDAQLTYAH